MKNTPHDIGIASQNGKYSDAVETQTPLPAPAVVVLHEVFGVNADIRKTCDELTEEDFIAVAPDLFWRQEPGVDLGVNSEPDWQHGLRLYQAYGRDAGVGDIRHTLDGVAKLPDCKCKIAVQGYCCGALMTFLTAVRSRVDAAVAYHGADTEKYLGEVDNLRAPLLMHLGEEDEFIPRRRKPGSRKRSPTTQTRQSTAIRGSITPLSGTTRTLRRGLGDARQGPHNRISPSTAAVTFDRSSRGCLEAQPALAFPQGIAPNTGVDQKGRNPFPVPTRGTHS
jgi:carboxymethylenebutenolidase